MSSLATILPEQSITLKVPASFEIPVIYVETTPQENAAILLLGCSIHEQLRRENYSAQVISLQKRLEEERASAERYSEALLSLEETIAQTIGREMDRSLEVLAGQMSDLSLELFEKDRKDRIVAVSAVQRGNEILEQRQGNISVLLDRIGEIVKREVDTRTKHTSSARGRDNELDSRQIIVDAFGTTGAGFTFHQKRDYSGDHIFDWCGLRIMWEDKNYTNAVPRAEIEKAWRDISSNKDCHVLLLVSANSGIVGYETATKLSTEMRNGQLMMYLSCFKQNADQIGYLRTVIQTILSTLKPQLLSKPYETGESDIALREGLTIISEMVSRAEKANDTMATDVRVKLATMKGSLERLHVDVNRLLFQCSPPESSPISSSSEPVESAKTKVQRKCSKCGQPGHTIRTCSEV